MAIPDGTQFVIVDLDRDNELVQIEFMLGAGIAPRANYAQLTN
jgi:hypothetical protein